MSIFGMVSTKSSLAYTELGLRSFAEHTIPKVGDSFILVDNDRSLDPATLTATNFPMPLQVDINPEPRGFAANFNRLIDEALQHEEDLYLLNNDLIFTPNWREPLEDIPDAILSPLSNREIQYASSVIVPRTSHVMNLLVLEPGMAISDFLGNEAAFAAIAEAHRKNVSGYQAVFVLPFCCTRIPIKVLQSLGHLDENYGRGGGEDFDYCLRSHLSGFPVSFALNSYVLHFGGKSSWSGAESTAEQQQREGLFRQVFRDKWGDSLFELILRENATVLGENLQQVVEVGDIVKSINQLLGERRVTLKL